MSYKRQNNPTIQNIQPVYQSSMSAQQKYLQIVESVKSSLNMQGGSKNKKIKGCQMHP